MEVRHIVLRGSNFEIGMKLAEIAYRYHGAGPLPYPDYETNIAQLGYFKEKHPMHAERMRGVAAAMGKDVTDSTWNFSSLFYGVQLSGCSVVFYPPATTEDSSGVLSRNFDFTTGTFSGTIPGEGEIAACARPYVVEMYPDEGYPSLYTCVFDMLAGAMDGVNSEGLTVAILSSNDVIAECEIAPVRGFRPGFNESQILRYLLDTCADAEEAKAALKNADLYYNTAPYHYLIADRHGNAFIWENSPDGAPGHVVEGDGTPLITTNFLRHRYPDPESLPVDNYPFGWFNRFRKLRGCVAGHAGRFDESFIMDTNAGVAIVYVPPPGEAAPVRTLWHALYYPQGLTAKIDFYLGEVVDPDSPGGARIHRSGYREFKLNP
jgi:hypothetical protein